MHTLAVHEGAAFSTPEDLRPRLRLACRGLQQQLGARSRVLEEADGRFTVRGVIGTIRLSAGVALDVAPKVGAQEDWVAAVLDLLLASDRIDVAGERRGGLSRHRNLLDVLAGVYAERLHRALRRDGPILVMERREANTPMLKGKLQTTAWARRAGWEPSRFPVAFQELSTDNGYSRTLAYVACLLAGGTDVPRIRGSLLDSARALRPGAPELVHADVHSALRSLPSQWAAYGPAWDIAISVLTRRSLLASTGARHGVSLAIEAWPLLERLLQRALNAAVQIGHEDSVKLSAPSKHETILLRSATDSGVVDRTAVDRTVVDRTVVPDGRLMGDRRQLATFEAKYAGCNPETGPPREHIFQALSTAAACDSPLAVLVYPKDFDPMWWTVEGFGKRPLHLAAIGLGLFDYRAGTGDIARGKRLLELLDGPPVAVTVPVMAGAR